MKRYFLYLLMLILFISSCSKNKMGTVEYQICEKTYVYAYNHKTNQIEEVSIFYEIKDVYDVFYLYTTHQNYLPKNYGSMASGNVGLINCKIEENQVFYTVDMYIKLCEDIEIFTDLLKKTNQRLGYVDTKILYQNDIVS